jgi:hypothetical protein
MTDGWRATVRLHVKVLSEPTSVSRNAMVAQMTAVYRKFQIDVVVASEEHFDLGAHHDLAVLNDLFVGGCAIGTTTPQQDQLFGHRNNAGPGEICIYFVRSTFFPFSGCGAFPSGKPGAVVASYASLWTLGHECGHVLGLGHVEPADRLMTSAGTSNVAHPPPTLTQPEAETIITRVNQ